MCDRTCENSTCGYFPLTCMACRPCRPTSSLTFSSHPPNKPHPQGTLRWTQTQGHCRRHSVLLNSVGFEVFTLGYVHFLLDFHQLKVTFFSCMYSHHLARCSAHLSEWWAASGSLRVLVCMVKARLACWAPPTLSVFAVRDGFTPQPLKPNLKAELGPWPPTGNSQTVESQNKAGKLE